MIGHTQHNLISIGLCCSEEVRGSFQLLFLGHAYPSTPRSLWIVLLLSKVHLVPSANSIFILCKFYNTLMRNRYTVHMCTVLGYWPCLAYSATIATIWLTFFCLQLGLALTAEFPSTNIAVTLFPSWWLGAPQHSPHCPDTGPSMWKTGIIQYMLASMGGWIWEKLIHINPF